MIGGSGAAYQNTISSCTDDVTSPGNYTIDTSIQDGSVQECITVDSSDVYINATDSAMVNMSYNTDSTAIFINPGHSNITIDDVSVVSTDIGVDAKSNVTVKDSTFNKNRISVYLDSTNGSIVRNNQGTYWYRPGTDGASVHLQNTTQAKVKKNVFTGPGTLEEDASGVWLAHSNASTVASNTLKKYWSAIGANQSVQSLIHGNRIFTSAAGVAIGASIDAIISSNTIRQTGVGIVLNDAIGNDVLRNTARTTDEPIRVDAVHNDAASTIQQNEFIRMQRVQEPFVNVTAESQATWNANFYGQFSPSPRTPADAVPAIQCSDMDKDGVCDGKSLNVSSMQTLSGRQSGMNIDTHPLSTQGYQMETVLVDDGQLSTSTTYPVDIAIPNPNDWLELDLMGVTNNVYVIASSDSVIDTDSSSFGLEVGNNVSEGRYEISDQDSAFGQGSFGLAPRGHLIDIVKTASDAFVRVLAQHGNSLSSPDIVIRDWLTLEEETVDNKQSSSGTQYRTREEHRFEINHSLQKGWIGYVGDNHAATYKELKTAQSGTAVNDIEIANPVTIEGTVTESQTGGVEGVPVRVKRMDMQHINTRAPYIHKPPVKTVTTDSSGDYSIGGLEKGMYQVIVPDETYSRVNRPMFRPDVGPGGREMFTGGTATFDFNVTSDTGNLSVDLSGKSSSVRYGLYVRKDGYEELNQSLSTGESIFRSVPTGEASITAYQFRFSEGRMRNVRRRQTSTQISSNGWNNVSFSFPNTVSIDVEIEDGSDSLVTDASFDVAAINESQGIQFFGKTSDGTLSMNVQNDTGYTMRVRQRDGTDYRYAPEEIYLTEYNTSNDNGKVKLTVSQAATMEGTVKADGSPVRAHVIAINDNQDIFEDAFTNESGEFEITGLQNNTNYKVIADPASPAYRRNETSLTDWDSTQNLSLSVPSEAGHDVAVTITDGAGNFIDGQVRGFAESTGTEFEQSVVGSETVLSGIQGRVYLQVRTENRGQQRRSLSIDGDRNITFRFEGLTQVTGTIKDSSGAAVGKDEAFIAARNGSIGSFDWDQTDQAGDYSLSLKEGTHEIQYGVRGEGVVETTYTVPASDATKDFQMPQRQYIAGTVNDTDGNDISGEIAFWNDSEESFAYAEFDNGTYNVSGLKSAGHNVWVRADKPSLQPTRSTVSQADVTGTSMTNFTLSGGNGQNIIVNVTDAGNDPVEGVSVATPSAELTTGRNGTVTFNTLEANTEIPVRAEKNGYSGAIKEKVSVGDKTDRFTDKNNMVNMTISETSLVQMTANVTKQASGKPVSDASLVVVKKRQTDSGSAVTGSEGNATIANLTSGEYEFKLVLGPDKVKSSASRYSLNQGTSNEIANFGKNDKYNILYGVEVQ